MGKALIIKGADFSNNALAQITVISDEVRALFEGHNVGEKGITAFQRFINTIGGLNGTLWSRIGRMYVPMLFESDTIAGNAFFDVKNSTVHTEIPSNRATSSFVNRCLTFTIASGATANYPIVTSEIESLTSIFGIVDCNISEAAYRITLKNGLTPRWNRKNNTSWPFTPGKTITAGSQTLSISAFGDSVNDIELSHAFIRSDGSVDYETSSLTGTYPGTRQNMVVLETTSNLSVASLMVLGYFKSSMTETELKTVTSALYQMYLDMNN